jgi:AcrR family transcriptional regulator
VSSALALVDSRGIEALTMRALAAELGVQAMSLYVYVRTKNDLLDGLMAAIDDEINAEPPSGTWRERLELHAAAFRAAFLRHPHVANVYATRATLGPAWARSVEQVLGAFDEAGLKGADAIHAYRTLTAFLTGYVLGELRRRAAPPLGERLAGLDPSTFPLTSRLARHDPAPGDDEFRLGLRVVLDGIEAGLVRRPSGIL